MHDGTENEELFAEHESLDSNNSNKYDNSAEDLGDSVTKRNFTVHCIVVEYVLVN